jgi:hypothetical protein
MCRRHAIIYWLRFRARFNAYTLVKHGISPQTARNFGLALLTSLPLAQYFVLRDHLRRAALWIPINMAAWLVGIAWTLAPSPIVDQSTPARILIVIYGIAGLGMAATVALITGLGMTWLLRSTTNSTGPGGATRVVNSADARVG